MNNKFPKYISTRKTAEKGVTLVKQKIENQFDWIFRPTPLEHDFGIDGYIDIVNELSYVTGKSIAVQIKTGTSYFKTKTTDGWEYKGDLKHLNYYLNLNHPVLIFIVDLINNSVYWTLFEMERISKTNKGWSINISKQNKLQKKHKELFHSLPGFEVDYMAQLEYQWEVDNKMKESGIILLGVDRSEIEQLDFSGFKTLHKRLTVNDEMIKKCRGKLSFVIFGYDDDQRELYQIEEVREWTKQVIPIFKIWGYFLNLEENISRFSGLMVLQLCSVDIMIKGPNKDNTGFLIEPDGEQTLNLMTSLFGWLNDFSDKYNISEEINKEHTEKIAKRLGIL